MIFRQTKSNNFHCKETDEGMDFVQSHKGKMMKNHLSDK